MMGEYYDFTGKPLQLMEWTKLLENHEYKRIAYNQKNDIGISTVWIGLNYNWTKGPPLIFETRVFGGKNDGNIYRYATEDEAIEGHRKFVVKYL